MELLLVASIIGSLILELIFSLGFVNLRWNLLTMNLWSLTTNKTRVAVHFSVLLVLSHWSPSKPHTVTSEPWAKYSSLWNPLLSWYELKKIGISLWDTERNSYKLNQKEYGNWKHKIKKTKKKNNSVENLRHYILELLTDLYQPQKTFISYRRTSHRLLPMSIEIKNISTTRQPTRSFISGPVICSATAAVGLGAYWTRLLKSVTKLLHLKSITPTIH